MGSKRWKKRPLKGSCPSLLELMETRKILTQVREHWRAFIQMFFTSPPPCDFEVGIKEEWESLHHILSSLQEVLRCALWKRGWALWSEWAPSSNLDLAVCLWQNQGICSSNCSLKKRGRPHKIMIQLSGNLCNVQAWPGLALVRLRLCVFFN